MRSNRIDPILLQHARQMRKEGTPAEIILWNILRDRQFNGFKFSRRKNSNRQSADSYADARSNLVTWLVTKPGKRPRLTERFGRLADAARRREADHSARRQGDVG